MSMLCMAAGDVTGSERGSVRGSERPDCIAAGGDEGLLSDGSSSSFLFFDSRAANGSSVNSRLRRWA
jgi:hypothetical protein